jgi:ElaB/YqjD/DUF883 family membrane-anchored ribosome-binding protein
MTSEHADTMINEGVAHADRYKIQTAEALEEAARRLRNADLSAKGGDVRNILNDIESRVSTLKTGMNAGYDRIEREYQETVEPVERVITDHPIPAVLIAAGIGVLLGMLIAKSRD